VDDVLLSASKPIEIFQKLASVFKLKKDDTSSRYLGIDIVQKSSNLILSVHSFILEGIRKIQLQLNEEIKKYTTLAKTDLHIELDKSPFLTQTEHKFYRMLVGMASWVHIIGRLDISFAVNRCALFQAAPRQSHLTAIMRVWGYLKYAPYKGILIESSDPVFSTKPSDYDMNYFKDLYPEAEETKLEPTPISNKLGSINVWGMVNAALASDKRNGRGHTGVVGMIGNTLVKFLSKGQSSVKVITYGSEFVGMRSGVEVILELRAMVRELSFATPWSGIWSDNDGVLLSSTNVGSLLKKRSTVLSFHLTQEVIAAEAIELSYIHSKFNYTDLLTKALEKGFFNHLLNRMLVGFRV